ncbi:RNA 2',3'-cyclic phosphodiesterase [Pontibacillus sp. HMF3514]|uniref:RNA 2',3'-cyclic phosphodiesterase n=1 Tax=Pontibacillus sp. HMF3514 TaxID=2692425 RepID=UPI00131F74D2|nr:RNA 2',3'-cyclic phosphodiesterase [Pontibacillus sp. HMF3514]QHE53310.1 RNA 2',3'-cyclic phosphodiesterase [Pontibacillus sp. HMF3514]
MSSHYFIGIPLPEHVRTWLKEWQEQMKRDLSYGVWTHELDFHITLKFLGAVEEDNIHLLRENLKDIQVSSFEIKIGELGHFGNPHQPRVVWAGAEKHQQLLALQKEVEVACENLGFPPEKRSYNPHITLAKKWRGDKELDQKLEALYDHLNRVDSITVDHFTLFKIHPKSNQKYEAIQRFPLQGNK